MWKLLKNINISKNMGNTKNISFKNYRILRETYLLDLIMIL